MANKVAKKQAAKRSLSKPSARKKAAIRKKASTKKRGRGRPPSINRSVIEEICKRLADGESLRGICADAHIPDTSTIRRWLAHADAKDMPPVYAEFRIQYAHAREDQADALADEILDEARVITAETANAKRVLIDALKWRAGKLKPKVYGPKVDHEITGRGGGPIETITTTMSPEEATRIYREKMSGTG